MQVESTIDASGHEALVSDLEASCRALVPPDQGTMLLFFVRGADGAVDPDAFHGSARPLSGDKWTLQTFWAAPESEDPGRYASTCFARAFRWAQRESSVGAQVGEGSASHEQEHKGSKGENSDEGSRMIE